ncbi:ATP-binding protein [Mucilaginibacter sp. CAU 1740]|uniref:sensor histidine kinase n=1 Tax=Mucilaginibacter sp. CAU 1740 TaxID=3140365 RepID=UPI00325A7EAA
MLKSGKLVENSYGVISKTDSIVTLMKDAEASQYGYLLTNKIEFLKLYNNSEKKVMVLLRETEYLIADHQMGVMTFSKIKAVIKGRLSVIKLAITNRQIVDTLSKDQVIAGMIAMQTLNSLVVQALSGEKLLLQERLLAYETFSKSILTIIIISAAVAFAISVASYTKVTSTITDLEALRKILFIKEQETTGLNEKLSAANEAITSANIELLNNNTELANSRNRLIALTNNLANQVNSRTEELALSESRFRLILQVLPQIAWTNTPEGDVDFYNQKWFSYTGMGFDETKNQGWQKVIHPDDLDFNIQCFKTIIESEEQGEFEIRERRYDGDYRCHLVKMAPLKNEEGDVQMWVGTATDIEDIKQLQRQKDDFINITSHELKTPLTSLKSTIQLIEAMQGNLTEKHLSTLIVRAGKGVNKLAYLIDELLYIGKVNEGQLNLNMERVNLMDIIRDSCSGISMATEFQINIIGDENFGVLVDPDRIEQVVINLVNNAVKYAPLSEVIDINFQAHGSYALVQVTDYGPGIPEDKLPFLFDRYYRVQMGGSQHSGLGIGLYISSEIIKKHGGVIGVNSELGRGSTFWFTFPIS